ncbi:MAG: hypothetical protein U0797_25975 [Gemmataceae bacterium]
MSILSGSYSRMERDMAGLFQVLYGKPDGTFHKAGCWGRTASRSSSRPRARSS